MTATNQIAGDWASPFHVISARKAALPGSGVAHHDVGKVAAMAALNR
jgi:hypothetical protein